MTTILVTGGAGYIGSHACKALAAAGYRPVVYDNLVYGHEWAVRWGPLEMGDIADRVRLGTVFEQYRPEAVMHFAAYAYVGESVLDPLKYYMNNVLGSLSLLYTMRQFDVSKLVFSSTCATYGIPKKEQLDEVHPQQPINPYGCSKLMVEQILEDFGQAYGLRSVTLRYFNAAGADPEGEIGEVHEPETHLIPLALHAALGRRSQVTVYGDDYNTGDGTCIRDYIHVNDLVDAHVLALRALQAGEQSAAYNLGNGQGYSVNEVIETARRVSGKHIKVEVGPRRVGDPPVLVATAEKARLELGWRPRYNSIEDIIGSAWKWAQKYYQA
ncbi:MAG TPA: UDP-glucose 4-epimerase GalE [Acidiferrobacteraceae bacterium]|nr:UDP-glucose 4-epimerase GalE [Acidiferrobacteraceae bacterium]